MADGDIDLDFGESTHQMDAGSEGEDLEDGEVSDDSSAPSRAATPVPPKIFQAKEDVEPGEVPITPGEVAAAREAREARERQPIMAPAADYPPLPRQPYPLPPGPDMANPYYDGPTHGDQWGRLPPEAITCKYYLRGGCAFGNECKYAHPPGMGGSLPPGTPHYATRGIRGVARAPLGARGGGIMRGGYGHPGMVPNGQQPPPPTPATTEESWEAGLRKAKELLKKKAQTEGGEEKEKEEEGEDAIVSPATERPKTPPTPEPEDVFGPQPGFFQPRGGMRGTSQPLSALRRGGRGLHHGHFEERRRSPPPTVPLSFDKEPEEYESYIPPPRKPADPESLPPPPKERNHNHPPPKIYKGTSSGSGGRRSSRTPSPVPANRAIKDREGQDRRSRERELRKLASNAKGSSSSSHHNDYYRHGPAPEAVVKFTPPIPGNMGNVAPQPDLGPFTKLRLAEQQFNGGFSPLTMPPPMINGFIDPMMFYRPTGGKGSGGYNTNRKLPYELPGGSDEGGPYGKDSSSRRHSRSASRGKHRRSPSSSPDSISSADSGRDRDRKRRRKRARESSHDSISSTESYDSQKHAKVGRIEEQGRRLTGSLKDFMPLSPRSASAEAVSDADSDKGSDAESKKARRQQLLQQLRAVEDQIAKKKDKK